MSKVKITPLGDRVAVKPTKEEEKSISGIILPESANDNEKTQLGEVVAVGELKNMKVSVGDTLLFSEYGYDTVEIGGDEYLVVKEDKMLAIINK